jgi:parallel beta-helix repeat protein
VASGPASGDHTHAVLWQTGTGTVDTGAYYNAIHVLDAPHALIQDNVVSYSGNHGNAVNCQHADDSRIIGNVVSNWNHNGLDIKDSTGVVVENNVAHDASIGAGVYGEYNSNLQIDQNYVYNTSNGVQVDDLTTARIENNFFVNAQTVLYLGPSRPVATILHNCATQCSWAIENDGSARQVDQYNDWACRNICQIGSKVYAGLQAYQAAGYGEDDVTRKSSCSPPGIAAMH